MANSSLIQSEIDTLQRKFDNENAEAMKFDGQVQELTLKASQHRQQASQYQDLISKKTIDLQAAQKQEAEELKRQADEALRKANSN